MHPEEISLKWLGAAGFEVRFRNRLVLVDPFLSRPADSIPRIAVTPQDYRKFDLLVASHGHFDHFMDVPYLAVTVDAPVYVPQAAKKDIRDEWRRQHPSARAGNPDQWRALEDTDHIKLDDLTVTPIRSFHEVFDVPTVAEAAGRIFSKRPLWDSIKRGLKAVSTHPYGNTHLLHFDWGSRGTRMMFVGSLARHVYGLTAENGRVDVLALPYCPANRQWMKETERLIRRFQPRAILVHHFDKFYPPIIGDMNMVTWKREIQSMFPGIPIKVPQLLKPFTLEDVQGEQK